MEAVAAAPTPLTLDSLLITVCFHPGPPMLYSENSLNILCIDRNITVRLMQILNSHDAVELNQELEKSESISCLSSCGAQYVFTLQILCMCILS